MESSRRRTRAASMPVMALVVACFLGHAAPAAHACSCPVQTTQEQVDRADMVALGRLETITPPKDAGSSTAQTTYTFQVEGSHKIKAGPRLEVRSARSGSSCGLEGMVVGQRYLVFAEHVGNAWEASLCGGTMEADATSIAEVEQAVQYQNDDAKPPTATTRSGLWWGVGLGLVGAVGVFWMVLSGR